MTEQNKNPLVLVPESTARIMKRMNASSDKETDDLIYCHLYGIVGDWYISEISENREKAYGFKIINSESAWEMDPWLSNCCEWGEICIKTLQNLVNEKFIKEKDIRFLITRDLFWKTIKFSEININQTSLDYPGTTDRNLSY